jgi:hypothetical protein
VRSSVTGPRKSGLMQATHRRPPHEASGGLFIGVMAARNNDGTRWWLLGCCKLSSIGFVVATGRHYQLLSTW